MKDFWIASGHHLLDRNASGGLVVTDDFLRAYFARPELMPPEDACDIERKLHRELLSNPRSIAGSGNIYAIADADARENWQFVLALRDLLLRYPTLESAYLALVRSASISLPPLFVNQLVSRDPTQCARGLRRSVRDSSGRAVLSAAADHAAWASVASRRRRAYRRTQPDAGAVADVHAGHRSRRASRHSQ